MASSSTSQPTQQAAPQATYHNVQEEAIDAEMPLSIGHPFDVWQHCLVCHLGGYGGARGLHRWQNCPMPQDLDPQGGDDLSWLEGIPRTRESDCLAIRTTTMRPCFCISIAETLYTSKSIERCWIRTHQLTTSPGSRSCQLIVLPLISFNDVVSIILGQS
jgi:hypothetical protein